MAWYDWLVPAANAGSHALTGQGLSDNAKAAWEWGKGRPMAPEMPANPYQQNWGSLVTQLEAQSRGDGPSLAGDAYKMAHAQGMRGMQSMSRGGSAGAARAGMLGMGRMNQGLAQGYSNARLQEQLAARSQLTQALGGAGDAWFRPQYANLQAQLGTPSNAQMLMNFLQQQSAGAAQMLSKAGTGGMA